MYQDDTYMQIYKHVKLAGRSNVPKIIFSECSCNSAGSGVKLPTGQTSRPPATSGRDVSGTGHSQRQSTGNAAGSFKVPVILGDDRTLQGDVQLTCQICA